MSDPAIELRGLVRIGEDRDELYDELGHALMVVGIEANESRGVFHLALSGGSTPEPFYMRLVTDPRFRSIPWKTTHVWIVDERRVPEDDEKSNFRMIRETLVDHVPIPQRFVHAMSVLEDDPVEAYEGQLKQHIEDLRLDFVVLGMGDDGHTASLFPGSPALKVHDRYITVNQGPAVTPPDRVTMTYPLLNSARQLAILVTGTEKAATLRRVADLLSQNRSDPDTLPITGIHPIDDDDSLIWYLDREAVGTASD